MRLLYGTGNPAKLKAMKNRLKELDIEIIGLDELDLTNLNGIIPDVLESGTNPLENARQKANIYYHVFHMPVFSCDSGLYIEELPEKLQPGVHVRRVNGISLTDEEMLEYYSGLAKQYGNLTARYKNAICLILDEKNVFESMADSLASEPFWITAKPHSIRKPGFPLDSLSLERKTGKYYYDQEPAQLDKVAVEDGMLEFFRRALYISGSL